MRYICSASEAIREGIKLWPEQCFHKFFEGDRATCATGAMIGAILERRLEADEMGYGNATRFIQTCEPIGKMFRLSRYDRFLSVWL